MAHMVTYFIDGEERTIETKDSMDSLKVAQTALSRGAPECFIDDDDFRFRLALWNETPRA